MLILFENHYSSRNSQLLIWDHQKGIAEIIQDPDFILF